MYRLCIFALVALMLAISACAFFYAVRPTPLPPEMQYACDALKRRGEPVSCDDIEVPRVVTTVVLVLLGQATNSIWHGITVASEETIFTNPQSDKGQDEILVHEMVHYVLIKNHRTGRCYGEALARKITDEYMGRTEPDEEWRVRYGCPKILGR